MELVEIARGLSRSLARLHFGPPVTHVYDPLTYAWDAHRQYLERWGQGRKQAVLVGMNPGPWGMAQTGVPFGEVAIVREWLGIDAKIDRPAREHPARPVEGLACKRSEVSGARLWGWARERFGTPDAFFARMFVANWCPLVFMEESGRNHTPDKLAKGELAPLAEACDHALRRTIEALGPEVVIGVGAFAETRARIALAGLNVRIGRVLHPSPASPAANRGWSDQATRELRALGIQA